MIWSKVFVKAYPFWEGCGLVWCEQDDHPFFWSIHSAKRPFFYIHTFLQIILCFKSVVRHGIEWIPFPQTAATTFAFSSVCFFFFDDPKSLTWQEVSRLHVGWWGILPVWSIRLWGCRQDLRLWSWWVFGLLWVDRIRWGSTGVSCGIRGRSCCPFLVVALDRWKYKSQTVYGFRYTIIVILYH